MLIYMHEQHSKAMLKFIERMYTPSIHSVSEWARVNVERWMPNGADDNDVMMLKEQIGNSFRVEARQMNSKNVVFCVRAVRVRICSFAIYTLRLFVANYFMKLVALWGLPL